MCNIIRCVEWRSVCPSRKLLKTLCSSPPRNRRAEDRLDAEFVFQVARAEVNIAELHFHVVGSGLEFAVAQTFADVGQHHAFFAW
jgi:hypothetical protein